MVLGGADNAVREDRKRGGTVAGDGVFGKDEV